jgi:hypothetical protein
MYNSMFSVVLVNLKIIFEFHKNLLHLADKYQTEVVQMSFSIELAYQFHGLCQMVSKIMLHVCGSSHICTPVQHVETSVRFKRRADQHIAASYVRDF